MDQQSISRETVARLRADLASATDPTVVAGVQAQIRLHTDLAGEQLPVEAPGGGPADTPAPAKNARAED